uniref:Solute carrier family 12 member 9 n=1 Tax=Gopherus evgoodei TaxID=1825980 RepID=A0A8C4YD37_9SAUR
MSTESSPLLSYRLFSVVDEGEMPGTQAQEETPLVGGDMGVAVGPPHPDPARRLSTFFGVVVPTVLSMFSIVVFMRVGFVVGHAGFLQSLLMLVVAYVIILLTVLSICAICTNGAIQGGGAYFMISRTLGPEFGGSIGLMFYLANVCACGVYILGLVEAVLDVFGAEGTDPPGARVLPQGYFYSFLYGSVVLLLCLLVCLVGARIYARAAFLIFLVVNLVLVAIFVSFVAVGPRQVPVARDANHTFNTSFTGFRLATLRANLPAMYSRDYTTNNLMTFATVFAVMFNGCTGIMAGSNMSGELRNASSSIPKGTIIAVVYTFIIYFLLFLMTSFTCERTLLKEDYGFFRSINLWPPLVLVGVYAASLSASMSSLIGASRILHALAKDDLFGIILAPAKIVSKGGNPWVAVLYTWALVQLVLFAGKLNTIAGIVTVFYLVAYAAVDLACLALEWASAPNFRAADGMGAPVQWGPAWCHGRQWGGSFGGPWAQHLGCPPLPLQVRKYLLLLDVRKEHVKFWRPQMLLMVANPRSGAQLVRFVNDLKKGGLFVLGHVEIGEGGRISASGKGSVGNRPPRPRGGRISAPLTLSLSLSLSRPLPGGMKPNTLVLGFYDAFVPDDYFLRDPAFSQARENDHFGVDLPALQAHFPLVRGAGASKALPAAEYVAIVSDAVKMHKNVCLARYFPLLDKQRLFSSKAEGCFVDVWPLNLLRPDTPAYVDVCSLFLLQLACILTMVSSWRAACLRLFLCVESGDRGWVAKEEKLKELLSKLRIKAAIRAVTWDHVVALHGQPLAAGEPFLNSAARQVTDEYLAAVNALVLQQGGQVAVRFLYLPRPPADTSMYERYLEQLEILTRDLGPTLLVHGLTPVTCTEL